MNRLTAIGITIVLYALIACSSSDKEKNILVIGDSISLGYFPVVARAMDDNINIVHNKGNAQHTGTGLEKIDEWLGDTDWDIITFNWGLWDLCYRHPDSKLYGNRDKENGKITFSPEEYGANLENLVIRLKQSNAKLVFISTSYVPPGEGGRFEGDDRVYNSVASEIMKKYHVKYLDINSLSKELHREYKRSDGDVHFTEKGYELLARPIIKELKKLL